ncbi:hypothetical protein [uncultured Tolumonas sp.]|uniref:hypothetical protein n=1 Tax=uncultured Tolumonas sp. TaxID=263765 RepID=UPI00292F1A11|nr:hypothetical protein [uncultured Tolumonas sp.]
MSKSAELYARQQQLLKTKKKPLVEGLVDAGVVQRMLDSDVDKSNIKPFSFISTIIENEEISVQEVYGLLDSIRGRFHKERFDEITARLNSDVLYAIAVPFGLGKFLAVYDKTGGNVDTVHNVRNGVYATEKERLAFENRGEYDKDKVHKHKNYIEKNKEGSNLKKTEGLCDIYSVTRSKIGKNEQSNLDHKIAGKTNHDDAGRVLAEKTTEDVANISENLGHTRETINKSKGAKKPGEFASWLEKNSESRKNRISELNKKSHLSDKEKTELNKLLQLEDADPSKIREEGKKAQNSIDEKVNEYYKEQKFIKNAVKTSVSEGFKMGWQQAVGIVIVELFSNIILEIKAISKEGFDKEKWIDELSFRFKRIAKNVLKKWKDALNAFKDGAISGFISNIITTLINIIATTAKRTVRIIREGIFSLYRAIKALAFPPETMTFFDAAHEAMKLIFAGGIVVGGVLLEEVIEKLVLSVPLLVSISSILVAVIVGSLTAIAMAVMAYVWDKIDLFGAIKHKQDEFVLKQLDIATESSSKSISNLLDNFSY